MKKSTTQAFTFILLGIVFLVGCKKDEKTEWDTELLTPIGRTTLSIENLIKDSLAKANGDNTVNLTYRSTIYELSLADQFIKIPDTSIQQNISVSSLALSQTSIDIKNSLGSLAQNLQASSDPSQQFLGGFLISNNNKNVAIPALNGYNTPPFVLMVQPIFK